MKHGYIESLKKKKLDIENKIELYTGYLAFLESEIEIAEQMYKDQPEQED